MKKFVLPEKWHVRASNIEEARIIGKWFDQSEFKSKRSDTFYQTCNMITTYGGVNAGNVLGNTCGKLISFDDFVKYIVNKKNLNSFIQTEEYNQILINLLK